MSEPDPATVLGVGAAFLVAFGAALYKSATSRSDIHNRWTRRVNIAVSALHEKTLVQLQALRDRIDDELPREDPDDPSSSFDPEIINLDPGPLSKMAAEAARLQRDQVRMKQAFSGLKRLNYAWTTAFALLLVPSIGFSLYYAQIAEWPALWWLSLVTMIPGLLIALGAGVAHVVLHHRLAIAQEHSGTTDDDRPPA